MSIKLLKTKNQWDSPLQHPLETLRLSASAEHVETNHNSVLHVQTECDGSNVVTTKNIVYVERDTKTGHVETEQSKLETEHVGTHSVLHVVTTVNPPEMTENAAVCTPTVNMVEPAITQEDPDDTPPVPAPVINMAMDPPSKTPKVQTCTLKLEPLRQLDIDVWCNKVVNYHKFTIPEPTAVTANMGDDSGYTLRKHKTKADITGISLQGKKSVDYTPMMQSDAEEEDDVPPKKRNKIQPCPNGPSPMVL